MRTTLALFLLLSTLLALPGCGGGGGSGPADPPPPDPDPTPANNAPVAKAGTDQSVDEGVTVTLDAGESSDEDGDLLSFEWEQVTGPEVTLSGHTGAVLTFIAPDVSAAGELHELAFSLTVADEAGKSSVDTVQVTVNYVDDVAPEIDVAFPYLSSKTSEDSIRIRGYTADDVGVANVSVSGETAASLSSETPFSEWARVVSLQPGWNTFDIKATDANANTATRSLRIFRESAAWLSNPDSSRSIAMTRNPENGAIYVYGEESSGVAALFQVDMETGTATVVSGGASNVGGTTPSLPMSTSSFVKISFWRPEGGPPSILVPISSGTSDRILSINLDDGTRSIITGTEGMTTVGGGTALDQPIAVIPDDSGIAGYARLLLLDLNQVMEVRLDAANFGQRSTLFSVQDASTTLARGFDILLDTAGGGARVIVATDGSSITAYDLASGMHSTVSDLADPAQGVTMTDTIALSMDHSQLPPRLLALAVDPAAAVFEVDPATGQRTPLLLDEPNAWSVVMGDAAADILVDDGSVLVFTESHDLARIDAGAATTVIDVGGWGGDPHFGVMHGYPERMTMNAAGTHLYVSEGSHSGSTSMRVREFDLLSGQHRIVSGWSAFSNGDVGAGDSFLAYAYSAGEIVLDEPNARLFVVQDISGPAQAFIHAVDIATGDRQMVFNTNTDGYGGDNVDGIALVPGTDDLLISTTSTELIALDLGSGAITEISNSSLGTGTGPALSEGMDFHLFPDMPGRLELLDWDGRLGSIVIAEGTQRGTREILQDFTNTGVAAYNTYPGSFSRSPYSNEMLYTDWNAVYSWTQDGAGTPEVVSGPDAASGVVVGNGPLLGGPNDVAVDWQRQRAIVTDDTAEAVFMIEMEQGARGDRVIILQ